MSDPFAISIVIVNWNSKDDLAGCLRALEAQTDRDFTTIVVDNGSHDGSVAMLRADFPWVRLIEAGENLGFAEGANRGIDVCTTPWVATLNNDTVVDPRWIEELRRAAKAGGARLGMLQSRVVFQRDPTRTNSTGVLLYRDGSAEDRDFNRPARDDDPADEVFCPTAGAALYRRAMLEETRLPSGFFDRTFFMYFEDVDLGWRCRLAGWEARYVPSAKVLHAFQASTKRQRKAFLELHCRRNRVRMLLKNGSIAFVARTLPETLSQLADTIIHEGFNVLPSYARAFIDGARQRREVEAITKVDRRAIEKRWVTRPDRRAS